MCRAWATALARAGSARPNYLTASSKVYPDDATAGSVVSVQRSTSGLVTKRRQRGGKPRGRGSHHGCHRRPPHDYCFYVHFKDVPIHVYWEIYFQDLDALRGIVGDGHEAHVGVTAAGMKHQLQVTNEHRQGRGLTIRARARWAMTPDGHRHQRAVGRTS